LNQANLEALLLEMLLKGRPFDSESRSSHYCLNVLSPFGALLADLVEIADVEN
jgi:hypothetical protein